MLNRVLRQFRTRSVTLSAKIMVVLLASVVLSLSLSGWLIYAGLRERTYANATESLRQMATTAAVGLETRDLGQLRDVGDASRPSYINLRRSLRAIHERNHFSDEGHWARVSVVRFDRELARLNLVMDLEGPVRIGRELPMEDVVYKAVARREAAVREVHDDRDDWLVAYAPLPQKEGRYLYLLKLEKNLSPLRTELLGHVGTIVLGALAGLLLAVGGGWLVTRQITQPLRTFVDVMRLMQSTGDFDLRIDLHPEDRDMSVVEHTFQSLVRRMQESREREEQSYWSTLQALVTALDVRDNETAGHSMRVTRYSLAIGERLRLKPEMMEQLRQGALLHDIGKIGVPDAVLRKAGKLNTEEWKEMRKHPSIGRTFLEDIAFLRPAMAVVYCHHERWDGTGYPQKLEGDAIPIAARIFAVADALDAITSQRYYKEARSFRDAQIEIEACAGSHFDPSVVKAFLTIPEKVFLRIRQETSLAGVEIERLRKNAAA
jgi:HD-GYP domain-containing protein (c-di-GMP phosphodiesterase class II)